LWLLAKPTSEGPFLMALHIVVSPPVPLIVISELILFFLQELYGILSVLKNLAVDFNALIISTICNRARL
jgi:hypothetical protein